MSKFILSAFADEIDTSLVTQMDVLEKHDISHIEMRGVNGKNIVKHTIEEAKDIKKQLDSKGFKISALGSPIGKINIKEPFEAHLDLFKHTLELAKILDTKYIRMFSFFMPDKENPEIYKDDVMERWEKFIKAAKGYELTLLHENEKDIYGDTAERCLDLMETLKCNYVKAIFDPANFVQCNVETYPYAYKLLKDYIVYFHIKDALSSNHNVVPSGYGDGKIKEILTEVYNDGFDGFLSLEPHLASFQGFSELELEPNSSINEMPEGGPKQFAIAADALKKIIYEIRKCGG